MGRILLVALMTVASPATACALALTSTETATVTPWGVFSVAAAKRASPITLEIAQVHTLGGARPEAFWIADKPETFWVAEKHDGAGAAADISQWADGRVCLALGQVVARLDRLGLTKAVPARGREVARVLSDNDLQALSACWSDRPPI